MNDEVICGSSSVVEHQLPKLRVAGSIPVSRSAGRSSRAAHHNGVLLVRKLEGECPPAATVSQTLRAGPHEPRITTPLRPVRELEGECPHEPA